MIPGHTYDGLDFSILELQDCIRYEERYATDTTSVNRNFIAYQCEELARHKRELAELISIKRSRDILGRWYERLSNPSRRVRMAIARDKWANADIRHGG
jgi:hypothetical protein